MNKKIFSKLLIIAIATIVLLTVFVLCVLQEIESEMNEFGIKINPNNFIICMKSLNKYYQLEEKSYSHNSELIQNEKKYRLTWQFLYAIDYFAGNKNTTAQRSFNVLKPVFKYKEAQEMKKVTIQNKKIKEEVKKVLLPIKIETCYEKWIFEYEKEISKTKKQTSKGLVITTIEKEVIKKGFPVKQETASTKLVPYLQALGLEEKEIKLLTEKMQQQIYVKKKDQLGGQ